MHWNKFRPIGNVNDVYISQSEIFVFKYLILSKKCHKNDPPHQWSPPKWPLQNDSQI